MAEKLGLNDIISGVSGLGAMAGSAYSTYSNVQGPDSWASKLRANELNSSIGNLNSFDDWTNAYLSYRPMTSSMLDNETFGFNKGQGILNIGNSILSGAGTGAKLGGVYGAIGGGLLGLGAGLFGFNAAKNKAENTRQYAKNMLADINRHNNAALLNGLYNIKQGQYDRLNYATYAEGGQLHSHGADWNTGLNYVGNGGSHEENPYDGVPMGIAPDGQPNLVEEGEVIWNNDYVFSKRLKVPKAVRRKYKLGGLKPLSFADAVMKVNKDVEERPNDPIALRGRDAILGALAEVQDAQRAKKEIKQQQQEVALMQEMQPMQPMVAANGGHLFADGTEYYTFLQDPREQYFLSGLDIPSVDLRTGVQKAAERWNNRYQGIPLLGPSTEYKPSIEITNPAAGWIGFDGKGNPIGADGRVVSSAAVNGVIDYSPTISIPDTDKGLNPVINPVVPEKNNNNSTDWVSRLRYIPAIGAGIGVFSDLMGWTNKPDYTQADAIARAARGIGTVSASPIGDYLQYRPMDRMFALNMLNANAGANRRALLNTTGGNRGTAMAGLLASDNNTLNNVGNLWRQAEEYNAQQLEKSKTFNRATNMFNSELDLKAQQANLGRDEVVMRGLQAAAAMRDTIDQRVGAAKSANLTNLFQSLGDIGWEAFNRNMINTNRALYYGIDSDGHIKYKDAFYALPREMQDVVRERAEIDRKTKKALGGRINKRRR